MRCKGVSLRLACRAAFTELGPSPPLQARHSNAAQYRQPFGSLRSPRALSRLQGVLQLGVGIREVRQARHQNEHCSHLLQRGALLLDQQNVPLVAARATILDDWMG